MKKIVALLPMKGHSERVPNKNMKNFVDKPLYHFVLGELLKSKYIQKVYINTDSEVISTDVKKHFPAVGIIQRPNELIGDFVSMNKIIEYDLSQIEADVFLQTHSTNPLLTVTSIDNALDFFLNSDHKFDSVFSVTKWQTRFYSENGEPVNHNPKELLRTQDLPPMFEENSNFYIFTKASFEAADKKRIGIKPKMYEMPPMEAVDIDTEFNFSLAEQIYKTKLVQL
jgi:N-acylneuraminate cytidylyltransferase